MKGSVLAALTSLGLLSSCAPGHEQEAVERIKDDLTDPDSAQFKNLHEIEREDGWIVCGEVNAKNRFGGYTGFRRFAMTEKKGDILFSGNDSGADLLATALIENLCKFPQAT